jgi:hypothetical protein
MGPSGLYGYWLERDMVHFSPRRAESMGTVSWRPGFSGLSGDAPDAVAAGGTASALDADAAGGAGPAPDAGAAGAGGAHAPDMGAAMAVGRDFIIVPLEDALVIALLAVVQAYVRGGVVNGSFDADEVVKLIVSETALAVGRSRVVGSLTEADLKRLLVPEAHGRGGLSDALIVLGAWVQLGKPLAAPVPPTWVVPPTPITYWPAYFSSPRGAALCIRRAELPLALAAIGYREMFASSATSRVGVRGDGGIAIVYSCLRSGSRRPGGESSDLALACPCEAVFEMALADVNNGLVLVRVQNAHVPECSNTSKHLGLRPAVTEQLARDVGGRNSTYEIMLSASKLELEERRFWLLHSDGIRLHGIDRLMPVGFDALASVRPRYAAAGPDASVERLNVAALLPVCIAGCEGGSDARGSVDWIGCERGEGCVSFLEGWAHKRCLFPHAQPPEVFLCVGCETGAQPATTIIAAGDGVKRVVEHAPPQQVLFPELLSSVETGPNSPTMRRRTMLTHSQHACAGWGGSRAVCRLSSALRPRMQAVSASRPAVQGPSRPRRARRLRSQRAPRQRLPSAAASRLRQEPACALSTARPAARAAARTAARVRVRLLWPARARSMRERTRSTALLTARMRTRVA